MKLQALVSGWFCVLTERNYFSNYMYIWFSFNIYKFIKGLLDDATMLLSINLTLVV